MLDSASNNGKPWRYTPPSYESEGAQEHDEPDEIPGLERWTGWRLLLAWLLCFSLGCGFVALVIWALFESGALHTLGGQW